MKPISLIKSASIHATLLAGCAFAGTAGFEQVPTSGPRTMVVAGQHAAFRAYCLNGEGQAAFDRIKGRFGMIFTMPERTPIP